MHHLHKTGFSCRVNDFVSRTGKFHPRHYLDIWMGQKSTLECHGSHFCLQDGKVPSATLPGAGAQVASDHHLGKAGGAATQVLSLLPMSNICFKYTLRSLEYFHCRDLTDDILEQKIQFCREYLGVRQLLCTLCTISISGGKTTVADLDCVKCLN